MLMLLRSRSVFGVFSLEPGTPSLDIETSSFFAGKLGLELGTSSFDRDTLSLELGTPSFFLEVSTLEPGTPSLNSETPSFFLGTWCLELGSRSFFLGTWRLKFGWGLSLVSSLRTEKHVMSLLCPADTLQPAHPGSKYSYLHLAILSKLWDGHLSPVQAGSLPHKSELYRLIYRSHPLQHLQKQCQSQPASRH